MSKLFRYIGLILLGGLILAFSLSSGSAVQAEIVATSPEFDFGRVPPNSTLVYRSWLRSQGADTVRLGPIKAGCGCIGRLPGDSVIASGDSLQIELLWRTRVIAGKESKSAYIMPQNGLDAVRIRLLGQAYEPADSSRGPEISVKKLHFKASASEDQQRSRRVRLVNHVDQELPLTLVAAPGTGLSVETPESIPANGEAVIDVELSKDKSLEPFEDSFTLEMTTQSGYIHRFTIPVTYGDFSFRPVFTKTKQ